MAFNIGSMGFGFSKMAINSNSESPIVPLEPETVNWINAVSNAGGTVSDPRSLIVNTFIKSMKQANLWNKMDVILLLAAENKESALMDIKRCITATEHEDPIFTVDFGYRANISGYINTQLTYQLNVTKYQALDAHISSYSQTQIDRDGPGPGDIAWDSNTTYIYSSYQGSYYYNLNGIYNLGPDTLTKLPGFLFLTRRDVNDVGFYVNGNLYDTGVLDNSVATETVPFVLLRSSGDVGGPRTLSAATIGESFSDSEVAQLSTIINNYHRALGINKY